MINIKPEFVMDAKRKRKSVILSTEDWDHVVAALEELDDIKAYDEAKSASQEAVPFPQAVREIRQRYKT